MHVLKWANLSTRMFFAPDDGGGSATASAGSSAPSGDGGAGAVPSSPSAGESAGAASPAPAPSSSPAPDSGGAAAVEPANPWDMIGSTDDLDHIEVPPAPASVAPVTPEPVAPQPAAASPAPEPQPPSPAQPEPAAQPAPASLSPSDPVAIATAMEASRNDVIAHLSTTKFALSEDDIRELETDVVAAVPKMMARAFFESQVAMQKFLAQAVPGMINNYQTVTKANSDAEDKFFTSHKALGLDKNNPQHRSTAARIASIYRQANPTIPFDQLVAETGPMVAAALRLNGQVPAVAPPTTQLPPGTPRGGVAFRPAVNGGGGALPVAEPENPWSGLGQQFD